MTALCHAARANNYGAIQALLEAHADPKLQDAKSKTPLWHAQQTNHVKCVKFLQAAVDGPRSKRDSSSGEARSSKEKRRSSVNLGGNDKDANSFATLLDQDDSPSSPDTRKSPQKAPATYDSSDESESDSESEEEVTAVKVAKRTTHQPHTGGNGTKGKSYKSKNSKKQGGGRLREEDLSVLDAENKWTTRWTSG